MLMKIEIGSDKRGSFTKVLSNENEITILCKNVKLDHSRSFDIFLKTQRG